MFENDKVSSKSNEDSRYWHSYGLQRLSGSRFLDAVGDILENRSILITPRSQKESASVTEIAASRARLIRL